MIIPIKCFTCGKVLADKYIYYKNEVKKAKINSGSDVNSVKYLTLSNNSKTPEGKILDDLNLTKACCRRHMLTYVDII